jgi:hypothetical protein
MSQRSVEQALGKLVTDEGFRDQFFGDRIGASLRAGLELSPEEMDALSRIPRSALEQLSERIDDRISRLHVRREPIRKEPTR